MSRLKEIAEILNNRAKSSGNRAIELGLLLIEAKELCQSGQWQDWVCQNFPYSIRTAQRFMAIAEDESLPENVEQYQSSALSQLKDEPLEVRDACETLAAQGETISPKKIEQVKHDLGFAPASATRDPKTFMRQDVALCDLRYLTAMARTELSTPFKVAIAQNIIDTRDSIFDYGCGRAGDIIKLRLKGYDIAGYDPFYFPNNPLIPSDIVTLNYVVNVIETEEERVQTIEKAYHLAKKALIVAIRVDTPPHLVLPYGDGHIVSTGAFQKHYTQSGAKDFLRGIFKAEITLLDSGIFAIEKEGTKQ